MIIITGVGRTGTSILTRFCKEIGLDVGSDIWLDKFDAGLENNKTVRINNIFRRKLLTNISARDFGAYQEIEDLSLDVVKDPQFLVHSELIKHWFYVRKDISIIFLYRKPEDVVKSLKRVPEMNSPVFRSHIELIQQKEEEFLLVINGKKIKHSKFEFPMFLEQFDAVYDIIYEFCNQKQKRKIEDREQANVIWNKIVNKKKVHIR